MTEAFYIVLGAALVVGFGYLRQRLWSFRAQTPADYAEDTAQFDLRHHLNGPIACEGVIYGPLGRVSSRFVGEFEAHWEGNVGIMKERFIYDSGSTQDREWHLKLGNDGRIQATAPDVIGTGSGTQRGSAVQLLYRIRLPEESGGHILDTTDWMYLAPNGTIVNRSQFRKFGIQVAELVATLRPAGAAAPTARDAA
ncbi:MAG: DUF3833 domain-containing protein [Rhodobacteraceae bacterium]|nr:DUF3833 domain-containing protein [Paracoccaceae bacterium]